LKRTEKNKIIFLYPGQGSQHVGMGRYLFEQYPQTHKTFRQADALLGFSLSGLCFEGPEEELNQDLNAQLGAYLVSCVTTDLLKSRGVIPDKTSGYSSGFYAAAYAAGCFDFAKGLELVKVAGEILLDEGKKHEGAMSVIFGLSTSQVEDICRRAGDAWVAIRNTSRQVVISGARQAVETAMKIALAEEALDAYEISAAAPYHSPMVAGAEERLRRFLDGEKMGDPRIPLVSYLSLEPVVDERDLKHVFSAQLNRPVMWRELIRKLGADKPLFVEAGAGAVISRTVIWIDRGLEMLNTARSKDLDQVLSRCNERRGHVKATLV
jgi:[acyl-carrier-protein] S-malonyltransferase